ncbi:alpha-1,2-fucosyltransferase [Pedobacter frigidisoli]|uniref:Alpha-1,2-fucosyltransferase n=1 Tax=Pedobacter frigidisoli TaxID=2530455 RepID=A0A4R0P286_9SPHI|nr:alpha-1,2-fucosyltransferase [Pedobacter frigidisoli]TCD07737.1 alpha-1,2-fucosyltransferase [Pedobacter frigidisoli]
MVIVKLQGGLGNQMFQYAVAKSLAKNSMLLIDTSFLSKNKFTNDYFTARDLALTIFNNIKLIKCNKLLGYLVKRSILPRTKYIHQTENNEWIAFRQTEWTITYLDGYFQDENYFKKIRSQLLQDFRFQDVSEANKGLKFKIMPDRSSVGIHVRRGDYLLPAANSFHGLLPKSYYDAAVEKLEQLISNPHFYVFSDDPDWCRLHFQSSKHLFTIVSSTNSKSWEDMYLMSICKHNIIANSSYSWWAAWLNQNVDKIIIAPKNWLATTETNIVPKEWIKI